MSAIDELHDDVPLSQKLLKKWARIYVFALMVAPVGYLIRIIISRDLGVETVGVFYSVMGLIMVLSMYNDLWLTEALQYYIPQYRLKKEYSSLKTSLYLTLLIQVISGIIIWWILFFGADWLAVNHFHSVEAGNLIRIMCLYFIGINFIQVFSSFFVSFQDTFSWQLLEFARMRSTLLFVVIFLLLDQLTLLSAGWARIIWIGASLTCCAVLFFRNYRKAIEPWKFSFDTSIIKKHMNYAFWTFLGANATTLIAQIDQQMVINILWSHSAWIYANFASLLNIFMFIITPIIAFLFPLSTELFTKQHHEKISLLLNFLYTYIFFLAFSLSVLFFVFWEQIAVLLYTSSFIESWHLFKMASIFLVFFAFYSINYSILWWIGKVKEKVFILSIACAVNIILNYTLIVLAGLGLRWALIAMLASRIILFTWSYIVIKRHASFTIDRKRITFHVVLCMGLWVILYYINWFLGIEKKTFWEWVGILVGVFAIYYCILWAVYYKNILALLGEIKKLRG